MWQGVVVGSIQTLSDADRRAVARWALACAEHVRPLFAADAAATEAIRDAVARTRAYSTGDAATADQIRKRFLAMRAATAATTPAGVAAGRAVGHAAAVAHMGAHALGAAAYAIQAVSLAGDGRADAVRAEIRWQLAQVSERERAALRLLPLVGDDSAGPLGPGLLSRGILGRTIRDIQKELGAASVHDPEPHATEHGHGREHRRGRPFTAITPSEA